MASIALLSLSWISADDNGSCNEARINASKLNGKKTRKGTGTWQKEIQWEQSHLGGQEKGNRWENTEGRSREIFGIKRVKEGFFHLSLPGCWCCVRCVLVTSVRTHNHQREEKWSDGTVLICSLHESTVAWSIHFGLKMLQHIQSAELGKNTNTWSFILLHTIKSWSFSHWIRSQYNAQPHLSILTYPKHFVTDGIHSLMWLFSWA